MPDETIERSFPVSAPAQLRLGNIRGTVNIQPGNDDLIAVTAVKHIDSGSAEDTLIDMKQEEDGRVIVKTRYSSDGLGRIFNARKPCKVDYDVRVPTACILKVSGVSCSTMVRDISGEIDLDTVSGSLTIEEVSGRIEISSVSGDVIGNVLTSPSLRVNTVSGDIDINQSDFQSIEAKTVSGDLHIETPFGEGPYQFNSVSGDILLIVPADTTCTVKVKGISGGFKSSLPLTTNQRKNGIHYAELKGGGVLVSLNTVSGSLILKSTKGDEIKPHALSHSRSSPREILEKIERGEISVDEGVQALKS
jgi:hypothetical protein